MWLARLFGWIVAAAGVALLVLIWAQLSVATGPMEPMTLAEKAGLSGVLLLLGVGAFAVVFGLDLALLPKSALRRWTPRLPPRPW